MAETQDKHYHIGQAIWPKKIGDIWHKVDNSENPDQSTVYHSELLANQNLINQEDNKFPEIKNVVKLGITTIPGVKFEFNYTTNAINDTMPAAEIGRTGFFELDVKDLAMTINSITVADNVSATTINNNYCYIDFIYYD